MFYTEPLVQEPSGEQHIEIVADGQIEANCPIALYRGAKGNIYGKQCAVDVDTDMSRIAVSSVIIADGESGMVQVSGEMSFASGGSANKCVTAISIAGVITAATDPAVDNLDDGALKGWCSEAGKLYKNV